MLNYVVTLSDFLSIVVLIVFFFNQSNNVNSTIFSNIGIFSQYSIRVLHTPKRKCNEVGYTPVCCTCTCVCRTCTTV